MFIYSYRSEIRKSIYKSLQSYVFERIKFFTNKCKKIDHRTEMRNYAKIVFSNVWFDERFKVKSVKDVGIRLVID